MAYNTIDHIRRLMWWLLLRLPRQPSTTIAVLTEVGLFLRPIISINRYNSESWIEWFRSTTEDHLCNLLESTSGADSETVTTPPTDVPAGADADTHRLRHTGTGRRPTKSEEAWPLNATRPSELSQRQRSKLCHIVANVLKANNNRALSFKQARLLTCDQVPGGPAQFCSKEWKAWFRSAVELVCARGLAGVTAEEKQQQQQQQQQPQHQNRQASDNKNNGQRGRLLIFVMNLLLSGR